MSQALKQSWQSFKHSKPGERFKRRYYQNRQSGHSILRKIVFLGTGALIFIAGLFFLPAPGPGSIILIIGASLMAQESLSAARLLDWTELRLWRLYASALRLWK